MDTTALLVESHEGWTQSQLQYLIQGHCSHEVVVVTNVGASEIGIHTGPWNWTVVVCHDGEDLDKAAKVIQAADISTVPFPPESFQDIEVTIHPLLSDESTINILWTKCGLRVHPGESKLRGKWFQIRRAHYILEDQLQQRLRINQDIANPGVPNPEGIVRNVKPKDHLIAAAAAPDEVSKESRDEISHTDEAQDVKCDEFLGSSTSTSDEIESRQEYNKSPLSSNDFNDELQGQVTIKWYSWVYMKKIKAHELRQVKDKYDVSLSDKSDMKTKTTELTIQSKKEAKDLSEAMQEICTLNDWCENNLVCEAITETCFDSDKRSDEIVMLQVNSNQYLAIGSADEINKLRNMGVTETTPDHKNREEDRRLKSMQSVIKKRADIVTQQPSINTDTPGDSSTYERKTKIRDLYVWIYIKEKCAQELEQIENYNQVILTGKCGTWSDIVNVVISSSNNCHQDVEEAVKIFQKMRDFYEKRLICEDVSENLSQLAAESDKIILFEVDIKRYVVIGCADDVHKFKDCHPQERIMTDEQEDKGINTMKSNVQDSTCRSPDSVAQLPSANTDTEDENSTKPNEQEDKDKGINTMKSNVQDSKSRSPDNVAQLPSANTDIVGENPTKTDEQEDQNKGINAVVSTVKESTNKSFGSEAQLQARRTASVTENTTVQMKIELFKWYEWIFIKKRYDHKLKEIEQMDSISLSVETATVSQLVIMTVTSRHNSHGDLREAVKKVKELHNWCDSNLVCEDISEDNFTTEEGTHKYVFYKVDPQRHVVIGCKSDVEGIKKRCLVEPNDSPHKVGKLEGTETSECMDNEIHTPTIQEDKPAQPTNRTAIYNIQRYHWIYIEQALDNILQTIKDKHNVTLSVRCDATSAEMSIKSNTNNNQDVHEAQKKIKKLHEWCDENMVYEKVSEETFQMAKGSRGVALHQSSNKQFMIIGQANDIEEAKKGHRAEPVTTNKQDMDVPALDESEIGTSVNNNISPTTLSETVVTESAAASNTAHNISLQKVLIKWSTWAYMKTIYCAKLKQMKEHFHVIVSTTRSITHSTEITITSTKNNHMDVNKFVKALHEMEESCEHYLTCEEISSETYQKYQKQMTEGSLAVTIQKVANDKYVIIGYVEDVNKIKELIGVSTENICRENDDTNPYPSNLHTKSQETTGDIDEDRNKNTIPVESRNEDQFPESGSDNDKYWGYIHQTNQQEIIICEGDITKLNVDVIVNSASRSLRNESGVAKAIAKAAGSSLQEACLSVVKYQDLNVTDVVATPPGNLMCRQVIHAVGPKWKDYSESEVERKLHSTIENSMKMAERYAYGSIAIPSISSGQYGVPTQIAARAFCTSISEYCQKKYGFKNIILVDTNKEILWALMRQFSTNKDFVKLPSATVELKLKSCILSTHHSSMADPAKGSEGVYSAGGTTHLRSSQLGSGASSYFGESTPTFRHWRNGQEVIVSKSDITKMKVDAIVNASNVYLKHTVGVAKAIAGAAGRALQSECDEMIAQNGTLSVKEVVPTSPGNLPCKSVFHAVGPEWHRYKRKNICEDDLRDTIENCLNLAQRRHCSSIAIPAISSGTAGVPANIFAKAIYDAMVNVLAKKNTLRKIYIVDINDSIITSVRKVLSASASFKREDDNVHHRANTDTHAKYTNQPDGQPGGRFAASRPSSYERGATGFDKSPGNELVSLEPTVPGKPSKAEDTCSICLDDMVNPQTLTCKHSFCKLCLDKAFQQKPVCPICSTPYGTVRGTQPKGGKMNVSYDHISLDGFRGSKTILIDYTFQSGIQGAEHPNPGKRYFSLSRTAYLPDTTEGRHVLRLLQSAFDARLVFTVGRSVTTGREDQITWNDIHHKTSKYGGPTKFGYPDPTYLTRVQQELAAKGIK